MKAELQVETLDHLGLVAGVIDELGLVEFTNEQFPEHPQNCMPQWTSGESADSQWLGLYQCAVVSGE
jgi:Domain of unknown function (DUF4277)